MGRTREAGRNGLAFALILIAVGCVAAGSAAAQTAYIPVPDSLNITGPTASTASYVKPTLTITNNQGPGSFAAYAEVSTGPGDYIHNFTYAYTVSGTNGNEPQPIYGFTDAPSGSDLQSGNNYDAVRIDRSVYYANDQRVLLEVRRGGGSNMESASSPSFGNGVTKYYTLQRSGDAVSVRVYNDAARTSLFWSTTFTGLTPVNLPRLGLTTNGACCAADAISIVHTFEAATAPPLPPPVWICNGILTDIGETLISTHSGYNEAPDDWSPDGGKIILNDQGPLPSGDANIATVSPDGGNFTLITSKATYGDSTGAKYSRDGTKIVYISDLALGGSFSLYKANADGTSPTLLDTYAGYGDFDASGSSIIYEKDPVLNIMNGDGTNRRLFVPVYGTHPVTSPAGTRIALDRYVGSNMAISLVNADGTGLVDLLNGSATDGRASVTPDDRWVVFTSDRAGAWDVWAIGTDGTNLTRLTSTGDNHPAVPSPDGRKIVFGKDATRDDSVYGTSLYTMTLGCMLPPTNLVNTTYLSDQITWTWTNPADPGFDHVEVWLDGTLVTNTSGATYTATGLAAGTSHTLTLKAITKTGAVNPQPVSWTAVTAPPPPQPVWTCSGTLTNVAETPLASDPSAYNSGPDFRRSDGRVAYAHGTWPGMEIWTMNPNGTNKARLTTKSTHGDSYAPAWSPDGTKIAYGSNLLNGGFDVWVMNADGSGAVDLASNWGYPRWSPDGTRIVGFNKYSPSGDERDLYVMNADGSNKTPLVAWPGSAEVIADWSPDGQSIVFESNKGGTAHLYLINPDGTGLVQLTSGCANDTDPRYGPDGTKISFLSDRAGKWDLWVMNADGTGATRLTTTGDIAEATSWSPDGRSIAFDRTGSSGYNAIYRLDLGCAAGAPGPFTPVCQVPDTLPPGPITNLTNTTYLPDRITWTWTNPADADFSKVMVYLDGVFAANTTNTTYTATGLAAGTSHTITVKTVDTSGNVGSAVNQTAATAPPTSSCPTVLSDDFNDGNINGWTVPAGSWTAANGYAQALGYGENDLEKALDLGPVSAFTLEFDTALDSSTCQGLSGNVLNATGAKFYGRLDLGCSGQPAPWNAPQYLLDTPLAGVGSPWSGDTQWHHVKVTYAGGQASMDVDGRTLFAGVPAPPTFNGSDALFAGWNPSSSPGQKVDNVRLDACAVAAPPSTGLLVATSAPTNASVSVDGSYLGQTPATPGTLNATLSAGTHMVTMTLPGFADCVQAVDIVADKANPVHCNFEMKVTPAVSGSDLVLSWPPVSNATYKVFKTGNKFGWNLSDYSAVSGTSATIAGGASSGGTEFYLVTTVDPVLGQLQSQLAFRSDMNFTFRSGKTNLRWISVPYGGTAFKKASDIVAALEPDGANSKISMVAKWDPATQATVGYGYVPGVGWMGTDFAISPGDGIYLYLSGNTGSFSWPVMDVEQNASRSFTFQPGKTNLQWVSIPFASNYSKASGIVAALEPSGGNDKISMVAKWDPATQATVGYGYVPGVGWMGTDFAISPGDGIYLYLSGNTGTFTWTPEMAVP